MAQITLKAATGRSLGSRPSRRLRKTGQVPAVVYGQGTEPRHVAVNHHDLSVALHTGAGLNVLIDLEIDDLAGVPTLVRMIDRHPYRNQIRHVDFVQVSLTEIVNAEVTLHYVGNPPGVKEGGILTPIRSHIEIEALPTEIPPYIEVDVSHLKINDVVRVSELPAIEGVSILDDPEELLITVSPPTVEVEAEAPEAEEGEEGAEGEEKAEEEAEDTE
ncbi:MAG: 50S ribosomal protein L25 [Acidimicrobiia bacterium]